MVDFVLPAAPNGFRVHTEDHEWFETHKSRGDVRVQNWSRAAQNGFRVRIDTDRVQGPHGGPQMFRDP